MSRQQENTRPLSEFSRAVLSQLANARPMDKIIRGVITYQKTIRSALVEQFRRIKADPKPTAVFFTCMDSRMLPTRFTQAQVGDMFLVRNAGNIIPHAAQYGMHGSEVSVTTEPAALELACLRGHIKHAVVCGHSDCKAMNALLDLHKQPDTFSAASPLDMWLRRHGYASLSKLEARAAGSRSICFMADEPSLSFEADVDADDEFALHDKLSQINTLQQLENISSHAVLRELLLKGALQLHAMWFDVYSGDVYYFSRKLRRFTRIDESTLESLLGEIDSD